MKQIYSLHFLCIPRLKRKKREVCAEYSVWGDFLKLSLFKSLFSCFLLYLSYGSSGRCVSWCSMDLDPQFLMYWRILGKTNTSIYSSSIVLIPFIPFLFWLKSVMVSLWRISLTLSGCVAKIISKLQADFMKTKFSYITSQVSQHITTKLHVNPDTDFHRQTSLCG